ncbi:MAG: hypothetical protein JRF65_01090 [Deltaproteobacteria bacterium]|nr:hypothetical protein [Deltaproteobacteria bacterium]
MKFVADTMLGSMARWLRVMGYDVLYQSRYGPDDLERLVGEGRILLTRHRDLAASYGDALLLSGDRAGDQLSELGKLQTLAPDPARWFTRCLLCNVPLKNPSLEDVRENVPEYVLHQNASDIRFCPSCGRFFWPGTHRENMIGQLNAWGFGYEDSR